MRVLLINPPRIKSKTDPLRTGTPSGLISIGAQIRKHLPQVELSFLDAVIDSRDQVEVKPGVYRVGLSGRNLKSRIRDIAPDVVGIGNIFTCEWQNAAHAAQMAKQACPDSTIVMGGHHSSFEAEFMLRNTAADYIVLREGELPFIELIRAISGGKVRGERAGINGVSYLSEGRYSSAGPGLAVDHLDKLEDPAFDLLDPAGYGPETNHCGGVAPGSRQLVDLAISRGCPNACSYCTTSSMWGRKIRAFSPKRVRAQVRKIARLGFDHVSVEDDHVLLLPEESRNAMFDELKKASIPWAIDAGTYYPLLNEGFVRSAAANGCHKIAVSFEHPALSIMHGENKYADMKSQKEVRGKIARACKLLRDHGVQFYAAMMVGFRQETFETLEMARDHAELIRDNGAQFATFFYWRPLPGTMDYKLHYHLVPEEDRWENNPEKWILTSPVVKPDKLTIPELISYVERMSNEINGHPNTLIDPEWK